MSKLFIFEATAMLQHISSFNFDIILIFLQTWSFWRTGSQWEDFRNRMFGHSRNRWSWKWESKYKAPTHFHLTYTCIVLLKWAGCTKFCSYFVHVAQQLFNGTIMFIIPAKGCMGLGNHWSKRWTHQSHYLKRNSKPGMTVQLSHFKSNSCKTQTFQHTGSYFNVVLSLNVHISAVTVSHLKFLKFIDFCLLVEWLGEGFVQKKSR